MATPPFPSPVRNFGLVASRISKLLIHVAEANGVPPRVMRSAEGLMATPEAVMAPSGIIQWKDLTVLADRVDAHFKCNAALEAVGKSYYQHLGHLPYARAASSVITLKGAFYISNRFVTPHNYEALICTIRWVNRREGLMINRLKYEGDPTSSPIAHIAKGILEYFPTLFGRDPLPFVEMEVDARESRLHIKLPPPIKPWVFMKRAIQARLPDHQRWAMLCNQEVLLRESQWEISQQQKTAGAALTQARENERQKLAQDLHDGLGQTLSGLSYRVAALRLTQPNNTTLTELDLGIRSALAQARDLAHRACAPTADEPTERFANTCVTYAALANIPIHFAIIGNSAPLTQTQADEINFILREALANAVRHSGASRLEVIITHTKTAMTLEISDNGTGICPDRSSGFGISSMTARALALSASIEWLGQAPGTLVRCILPLTSL